MLSVKYVFHIWQETNGWIVILKTVLKSDLWPGSEKCRFNPKFEDNDLKSGCYRISKLPPLSVNYVCPISQKTNHPIMIPKIVLKSVLWRGSESALTCCIFQLLCFSLHPNAYYTTAVPPLFLVRFPKCALRLVLFKVQMLCLQQSRRRQGWSLAITKCIMQADAPAPSGHWWELPRGLSNPSALSTFVKSIWTLDIPSLALQWKSVNLPL